MKTPHRRDISARQDLLGKELRQLFDTYTKEDIPDELLKLAEQLQSAVNGSSSQSAMPTAAEGASSAADEAVADETQTKPPHPRS